MSITYTHMLKLCELSYMYIVHIACSVYVTVGKVDTDVITKVHGMLVKLKCVQISLHELKLLSSWDTYAPSKFEEIKYIFVLVFSKYTLSRQTNFKIFFKVVLRIRRFWGRPRWKFRNGRGYKWNVKTLSTVEHLPILELTLKVLASNVIYQFEKRKGNVATRHTDIFNWILSIASIITTLIRKL